MHLLPTEQLTSLALRQTGILRVSTLQLKLRPDDSWPDFVRFPFVFGLEPGDPDQESRLPSPVINAAVNRGITRIIPPPDQDSSGQIEAGLSVGTLSGTAIHPEFW